MTDEDFCKKSEFPEKNCQVAALKSIPSCSCSSDTDRLKIGYIQRFCSISNTFKSHETLYSCRKCDSNSTTFQLSRGGALEYIPTIMDESKREDISKYMEDCDLFRQYRVNGFREPRVHVLLSSSAEKQKLNGRNGDGPGYQYHGVQMKAQPLSEARVVELLASELAEKFGLPNNQWSIGVDLVTYRNGNDRMGWHADDTQEESLILTVVVETDARRIVKIRPKKGKNESYNDGDELIELIVRQGSAYKMDGMCSVVLIHDYIWSLILTNLVQVVCSFIMNILSQNYKIVKLNGKFLSSSMVQH